MPYMLIEMTPVGMNVTTGVVVFGRPVDGKARAR